MSLCGKRPWYSLCVSSGFGGGAEFDWNLSHVLSQRVLSSCQLGRWWGLRQRSWSRSQGWDEACAGSAPTECSFPSQYWYPQSRTGPVWTKRGWCVAAGGGRLARARASGVWSGCRQRSGLRLMCRLVQLPVMAAPSLLRCHLGFEPPQQFVGQASSLVMAALTPLWSCNTRQMLLEC